jgi:hypothetical protein
MDLNEQQEKYSMRHEKTIPARELCIGDELSWDRVERFFWLTVQDVTVVSVLHEREYLIVIDFVLPFHALKGLGRFNFSETVYVHAIDVDTRAILLRQQNNPEDILLIRQKQAGES